jgi:acetyl-CoA carboxylase biotin carboxyl carrier protein
MDIKILKEITKLMKENDLVEVEVESADLKVKLKKASSQVFGTPQFAAPAPVAAASAPAAAPVSAPAVVVDEFAGCKQITSPIPGIVYLRPNPDAANFVSVGSPVDETKVTCLIEAMKVFNEIKPDAGIKGTIKKICVNDGQPVEYGTVLFLVG